MRAKDIYTQAYRLLNTITPLKEDCGKACNQACCRSDDGPTGMYLFPLEHTIYENVPEWIDIQQADFEYGGRCAKIAFCVPPCARELRPLSCRIFPLFPYLTPQGDLRIIMDPRGFSMCPLSRRLKPGHLHPLFQKRVRMICKLLIRFEPVYTFLYELSRYIDEIRGLI